MRERAGSSTSATWARSRRPGPAPRASPAAALQRRRRRSPSGGRSTPCCATRRRRARRPLHLPARPDRFLTVTNASNHEARPRVVPRARRGFDVAVADALADYAMLAVQGPGARARAGAGRWRAAPRFRPVGAPSPAPGVLVCGTGYTGEDGVELLVAPGAATRLGRAGPARRRPSGLGARDTLRLEACFHLYGNDLSEDRGPIEAGPRLVLQGGHGLHRRRGGPRARASRPGAELVPFAAHRPGIARQGNPVAGGGVVTSGTLSPCSATASAWPTCRPPSGAGHALEIDVRGKPRAAEVAREALYTEEDCLGRGQLPVGPQVPRRARLGAHRRRRRDVRHHLVRPGPARRGRVLRPARGRRRRSREGEPYAEVESVKAVSDVIAPLSGEIVEVNEALADAPEAINDDPYGEGWMVKVRSRTRPRSTT